MRFMLGKLILAPAVMAAAALATTTATAETAMKVPFGFSAAGKSWPAGTYVVQKDLSGNLVTVRSRETAKSFTCILGPGAPAPTDTHVSLQFDEAGSTHALRTIQYGAQITSRLDGRNNNSEHLTATGR